MKGMRNAAYTVIGLFLLVLLSGCGGLESLMLGSTLSFVGEKGADYFSSGKVREVVYRDLENIDAAVQDSFRSLSCRLNKRQLFEDQSLRYLGHMEQNEVVNLQVDLREIAAGITEITVEARDDFFFPESDISLILMKEIMVRSDAGPSRKKA
jgi:hypothetical protein